VAVAVTVMVEHVNEDGMISEVGWKVTDPAARPFPAILPSRDRWAADQRRSHSVVPERSENSGHAMIGKFDRNQT